MMFGMDLPVGKLTVVSHARGHTGCDYEAELIANIQQYLAERLPVVYVDCGGFEVAFCDRLQQEISLSRFTCVSDEDEWVWLPDGEANRVDPSHGAFRAVSCGVSTLGRAGRAVDALEFVHGPSLLILDQVDYARPYASVAGYAETEALSHVVQVSPTQRDAWLASDVHRLAGRRPNAPTIAMTLREGTSQALQALASADRASCLN